MKTLKKVLCLVLALVMVVGTMAISAAAYTDEISEDYEEAVAVLSAIKVIDGYGDDVFGAKDGVTRAQALAFVVRAMLTRSTANKLNASTAAFADVTDDWAKGVVSYAVAEGMANGWNGNFAPNDPVTGYAFEKFVLTALGIEGEYTGTNWENNVLLAANKAGLLEGMEDDFDLSANLNREQAAQLAYNMINYAPDGQTTGYVVKASNAADAATVWEGTDAITALLMKQSSADYVLTTKVVNAGSMGAKLYGLSRDETTDNYGRTNVTVTGNDKVKVVLTNDSVFSGKGVVKIADIAKALGATAGKTVTLVKFVDGVKGDTVTDATAATEGTVGAIGATVEVYKNGNTYNVVVTNVYVGKVTKVNKAVAATASAAAVKRNIEIGELKFETESFEKDDIVLYTKLGDKVDTVALADSIVGKVTAKGSDYVRIDGEKYNYHTGVEIALGATKTFYLDGQNNIIMVADAPTGASVTYEKVYVLGYDAVKKNVSEGTNLFDQAKSESWTIQAKIVDLKTGEIKVVDVATATKTDKKVYLAAPSGAASDKLVTGKNEEEVKGYVAVGYHDYAVVDGKYAIAPATIDTKNVTLIKTNAQIATGIYANSKTVVYVLTGDKTDPADSTKFSVTTTSGLSAFPTTEKEYNGALVIADSNGYATAIYAIVGAKTPEATVNYAIYLGNGEEIVTDDGNVQLVKFTTGEYKKAVSDTLTTGVVYDITVSDGKITKVGDLTAKAKTATIDKLPDGENYFTVKGTGSVVNLADDVVVLDATDSYKAGELEEGNYITYFVNDKDAAEFIVISKAPIA